MSDYTPYTYSLGFSITSELTEGMDDFQRIMNQNRDELLRWMTIRTEIDMGMPLNNADAKLLLASLEEAKRLLAAKPAPTILHTLRAWLAAKIAPAPTGDDYD